MEKIGPMRPSPEPTSWKGVACKERSLEKYVHQWNKITSRHQDSLLVAAIVAKYRFVVQIDLVNGFMLWCLMGTSCFVVFLMLFSPSVCSQQ